MHEDPQNDHHHEHSCWDIFHPPWRPDFLPANQVDAADSQPSESLYLNRRCPHGCLCMIKSSECSQNISENLKQNNIEVGQQYKTTSNQLSPVQDQFSNREKIKTSSSISKQQQNVQQKLQNSLQPPNETYYQQESSLPMHVLQSSHFRQSQQNDMNFSRHSRDGSGLVSMTRSRPGLIASEVNVTPISLSQVPYYEQTRSSLRNNVQDDPKSLAQSHLKTESDNLQQTNDLLLRKDPYQEGDLLFNSLENLLPTNQNQLTQSKLISTQIQLYNQVQPSNKSVRFQRPQISEAAHEKNNTHNSTQNKSAQQLQNSSSNNGSKMSVSSIIEDARVKMISRRSQMKQSQSSSVINLQQLEKNVQDLSHESRILNNTSESRPTTMTSKFNSQNTSTTKSRLFIPKKFGSGDYSGAGIEIDGILIPLMLKNGDCGYVLAEQMCIHLSGKVECVCNTLPTTDTISVTGQCSTTGCMCHALDEANRQECVCRDH